MVFYLLKDLDIIGKIDDLAPYLYDSQKGWVPDEENLLMDRLLGYDRERIGGSMIFEIEKISEEQANKLIQMIKPEKK